MQPILLLLLVAVVPAATPQRAEAVYRTQKSLAELEQCLTQKLSQRGDVTAVAAEGYVTLMYNDDSGIIMAIDLAPPTVTVNSKFAHGTRTIIKSCLR